MSRLTETLDSVVEFGEDLVDIVIDAVGDVIEGVADAFLDLFGLDDLLEDYEGILATKRGNVASLPVVYGNRTIGGNWIHMVETGADNKFLWLVYALADADSPINAITNIYLDDIPYTDAKYSGHASVETTVGGHTTQPFTALQAAASTWTANHRLLRVAAVAVKLTWNADVYRGLPKLGFELQGSKILNISVLPTETRIYSTNPAEVLFDYLTNPIYGKGLSIVDGVDLDLQSFLDAKSYCNDSITSYSGGPSHTRMDCHLVLPSGRQLMQNIKAILKSCRGTLPYINGVFYLVIERHYTPADYGLTNYFDFNIDNIIGRWGFKSGDVSTRYNRVKASFPNEAIGHKSDFVVVESATFRAADGRLLERTISLPSTTNVYRAIDTASIILRKSRQQISVSFTALPEALKVRAGTIVTVTHPTPGWTLKQFRVSKIRLLKTGNCAVTLTEHEESIYDLSVPNEVVTPPDTDLPDPSFVPVITNLVPTSDETVLKIEEDGTLVTRLYLTWDIPTNIFVNGYDVEIKLSSDSLWLPAGSPNSIGSNEIYIPNLTDGGIYDYRVRAHNSGGFNGAWNTATDYTVIGKTSKPSDVTGFIALQRDGTVVFRWNQVLDKDLAGYDIRYAPQGVTLWEDASTLTEATRGTNVTSADVSPGNWTFFIKAIDTSKNESVNAGTSDILVSNEQIVIRNQLSSPDWPGTLTGFSKHWTGKLVPNSTSNNAAIGWRVFDEFVPDPVATATYESVEIDVDFDDTLRVWGEITSALGFGETGQANPVFEIDYKLDAGSYDGFEPWSGGQVEFRYVKAKLTLTTANGVAHIDQLDVTVDVAERVQRVEGITVAASGESIVFPQRYHSPPFVQPYYVGSGALIPSLGGDPVTGTGFTLHLFNTSDADVGGTGGAYQAAGG